MAMTLNELAQRIGADVRGDGDRAITQCNGIEEATSDQVSFLANRKYNKLLQTTNAGAVIVSAADAEGAPEQLTLLIAKDPYFAFREALVVLHGFRKHPPAGIADTAIIDPTATIGDNVCIQHHVVIEAGVTVGDNTVIYPHCYLGRNAKVGNDCQLYPSVTIYNDCVLGNRVTLQASCVIGQDGFGYATYALEGEPPRHHKIPPIGNAVIEDDVEMGAGCTIDRATVGSTVIGAGTKFSNAVTIGHGTRTGQHNLLVAQVGLAGSVTTGSYVVMGGQVGVAGHLKIADGCQFAAKSGVMEDTQPGEKYGGQPAMPVNLAKRNVLASLKLGDMAKDVKRMKKQIAKLEAQLENKLEDKQADK